MLLLILVEQEFNHKGKAPTIIYLAPLASQDMFFLQATRQGYSVVGMFVSIDFA